MIEEYFPLIGQKFELVEEELNSAAIKNGLSLIHTYIGELVDDVGVLVVYSFSREDTTLVHLEIQ
jgi:hypothetical protein